MSRSGWQGYVEEHAGRLVWGMVAVWTILMGASLLWNLYQIREFALELARNEAQISFNAVGHGLIWLLGMAGIFVGGRHIHKYLHERRQAEAELAETLRQKEEALAQSERLATFPQLNPNPVLEVDVYGVITYANQGAVEALQPLAPEAGLRDFLPGDLQEIQSATRKSGEKVFQRKVRIKNMVFEETIAFAEPFDVWRIYANDITERQRAEEALQERSAELSQVVTDLEQKNAELERFAYMISHDLKSPLVTFSTFLGYLENDLESGDTGRIAKDMQYMRTAADKMRRLLEELLEMSRVGRVVNQPVKVTFQELVEEALNAVAGPLLGRGLEVQVSDSEVTLCGDRPRLVEIWQNLVENAVKFMGEQPSPRLEIGCQRQGDDVIFFVCDNGMGVDPRYQSKIFGIFEKLDSSIDGTGIGLTFVKRIVELYKGNIWVESAGQGRGACFRFTLPGAVGSRQ